MYQNKKMAEKVNTNAGVPAAPLRAGNNAVPLVDQRPATLLQLKGSTLQLKNGKKKKGAPAKESKAQRSLNNIAAYRGGWFKKNDIDLAKMQEFVKTYPNGIRGHASGDSSKGEQGNTEADCNAYKSWHRGIYGWR